MRLLLTNDDGVLAPGHGRSRTKRRSVDRRTAPDGEEREAIIVAPHIVTTRACRAPWATSLSAHGQVPPPPNCRGRIDRHLRTGGPAGAVRHPRRPGQFRLSPDVIVSGINAGANVGSQRPSLGHRRRGPDGRSTRPLGPRRLGPVGRGRPLRHRRLGRD
jgi:broad specificity polyphosphatase/5'/3'-nucleotidase SurE